MALTDDRAIDYKVSTMEDKITRGTDGLSIGLIRATYDFAADGGAVSTIDLGITVPDNTIIIDGAVDVVTTCTSAADTATIAIQALAANDLVTAIAINNAGNPWDAGLHNMIPNSATAADWVKMTSAITIKVVIAVQAVTAGKFHVFLRTVPGG